MPQRPPAKLSPESRYSIYVFPRAAHNGWERKSATGDKNEALRHARDLHRTGAYRRVEVKRQHFDPRKKRSTDSTVKVYGPAASLAPDLLIAVLALCGMIALALGYALTQAFIL